MKLVTYDDGNASEPNHIVLVRTDDDKEARTLADQVVANLKDPDEEWFHVAVTDNHYNLVLPPLRNAELL